MKFKFNMYNIYKKYQQYGLGLHIVYDENDNLICKNRGFGITISLIAIGFKIWIKWTK